MRLNRGAFRLDHEEVTLGEVLAGSLVAGSLAAPLQELRHRRRALVIAEDSGLAIEDDELQDAFDAWRQERDLIAAEELERWLEHHGVDVDDIAGHLHAAIVRVRLASRRVPVAADASDELESLLGELPFHVLMEGTLGPLIEEFAMRACAPEPASGSEARIEAAGRWMLTEAGFQDAGAYELAASSFGVEPPRARWAFQREIWFRLHMQDVLTQEALRQGLAELREDLVQYELSTATFADEDVAREVACCVREDRDSFSRAAARAGEAAQRGRWFHGELERAPFGERLASTRVHELVGPRILHEGRALLGQLRAATEPELSDPLVLERVERRLVERSLRRAVQQRVLFPPTLLGVSR